MKRSVSLAFTIISILLLGCGDLDLGMKYQKTPIINHQKSQISGYHVAWGLSSSALYISANTEVCEGFDSTKDFCFPSEAVYIYYKMQTDSLQLYTDYLPHLPNSFPIPFKIQKLELSDWQKYEEEYKKGKINKIVFDTIVQDVPCTPIPKTPFNNMKFKK
ncbi:MAG TPA: hypothetical protein VNS32_17880 [Flavisolibacter sp.]|nr:hypothetical protein [Flavisolibacter sp.]